MRYIYIGHDDFLMERGVSVGESYEGTDFGGRCILIYYYTITQHYISAPCKRTCLVIDPEQEDISDEFTLL